MQAGKVTMEEQNRVNRMFQKVIKIIRTTVKSDVPDQFFSKSEELDILGKTVLGTLGLEESKTGQQTLSEIVFKGPTNVISGAKDIVLDQLHTRNVPALLMYKDGELWSLLKRVFSWLRKERQKNEFIVKQLLNSITLQLKTLQNGSASTNDADEEDIGDVIVSQLLNIGFVEMLCSLISRNISAQPAISCLCYLLQFSGAQKQMLQVCMSNEEPIFEWVWDQINTAVSGYIQFNMARNVMLSAARPIIDIDTATPHMRLAVQFIGRLSNKTSKIQDYLRNQHNKIVSHNFLSVLLTLLRTIPKHDLIEASSNCQIRMKQHNKMIVDTLVALGDMLSTNTTAKEYAIEMGIIESTDRLLVDISSLDSSGDENPGDENPGDENPGEENNIKPGLSTVSVEDVLRIRINCYDVLVTLLEYDQKLLDVGEKISDVMSVNDLKLSVVNQLKILNQKSSPELRELSSMAAFKGYNVLKKIEGMEGFSAKDKSVPDIDKTIAEDVTIKSVEVMWRNSLEKLYFPIQNGHEDLIRRKVKDQMLWGLSRKTLTDKNVDFLGWSEEIIKDMKNMYNLKQIPIVKELVGLEFLWDWLVLLLAIVIQLWLLVDLEDFGMRTSGDKTCGEGSLTNMIEIKNFPADNNSTNVCVSKVFSKAHDILGAVHLASTILLAATYATTNWHRFDHPTFNWRAFIWGQSSEQANAHKNTKHRMKIDITSFYNVWLLIMISCSALGILFHGQLYCVHLMHIVAMFDLLTRVIRGATANRDQLLVIIPFAVFIIYIYSMIYFTFARSMFDNDKMEYCNTLAQCFSTAIRYSMRNSNGGHNYSWTDKKAFTDMWIRIAIDVSFWLIYSIIGIKVVTALVIDGFTSQKKLRKTSLEDMSGVCSICGLTKDEVSGKGIDWDTHKQEHNLWSYVNLFYYLKNNKRSSKLSAIEDEVLEKFERGEISFLPRKTSLSWKRVIKEREDMREKERIF
ncbi:uncharacterized protein LOC134812309 [Bolinopsis microptera]|uniref:uncharacterized protein LOC134812309 n=1 Tax=Bolinopsis microptera TaxID=2820187 RepID=UPI003079A550